jgi:hypothetical protein
MYGQFNDIPPGWKEVDEEYIVTRSLWRTYAPRRMEYRQIRVEGQPYMSVTLYFFHDGTGVGMHFDYWGKKIRWFHFGCEHVYTEIERPAGGRSGIHKSKCTKCEHIWVYDTSD